MREERVSKENLWRSGGHFLPAAPFAPPQKLEKCSAKLAVLLLPCCSADPPSAQILHCRILHQLTAKGCHTGAVGNCMGHSVCADHGFT